MLSFSNPVQKAVEEDPLNNVTPSQPLFVTNGSERDDQLMQFMQDENQEQEEEKGHHDSHDGESMVINQTALPQIKQKLKFAKHESGLMLSKQRNRHIESSAAILNQEDVSQATNPQLGRQEPAPRAQSNPRNGSFFSFFNNRQDKVVKIMDISEAE